MIALLEDELHEVEVNSTDKSEQNVTEISSCISCIKCSSTTLLEDLSVLSMCYDPYNSSKLLTTHAMNVRNYCLLILMIFRYLLLNIFKKHKFLYRHPTILAEELDIRFFVFGTFSNQVNLRWCSKVTGKYHVLVLLVLIHRMLLLVMMMGNLICYKLFYINS